MKARIVGMLSAKRIHKKYGDNLCRKCINELYRTHLTRENCVYGYIYNCPHCGEMKNIVIGFKGGGKLKMLLKF